MAKIFPSLIAADLMNLRRELEILDPHCEGYHLDIMDNHFVPNLTWGAPFINEIARTTAKPLWVHLMVDDPTSWLEILTLTPHSTITFHVESAGQIRKNIERLRERNIHPGLALNPQTPIETVFPFLDVIDSVLIMSVEPGFSGQSFVPKTIEKLEPLVGQRQTNNLQFSICMDGGIAKNNIGNLAQKGVDWFAVASSIFGMPNRVKAIEELRSMIKK